MAFVILLIVGVFGYFLLSGCQYNGEYKLNSSSFKDTEDCNTCACSWGSISCTEMACINEDEQVIDEIIIDNEEVDESPVTPVDESNNQDQDEGVIGTEQNYSVGYDLVDGYYSRMNVEFQGPTGLTFVQSQPSGRVVGGITINGDAYAITVTTVTEDYEQSFGNRINLNPISNPTYGNLYKVVPLGGVGTLVYANNVSLNDNCMVMGDEMQAPCGLEGISWIISENVKGGVIVACASENAQESCDEIMQNIKFTGVVR